MFYIEKGYTDRKLGVDKVQGTLAEMQLQITCCTSFFGSEQFSFSFKKKKKILICHMQFLNCGLLHALSCVPPRHIQSLLHEAPPSSMVPCPTSKFGCGVNINCFLSSWRICVRGMRREYCTNTSELCTSTAWWRSRWWVPLCRTRSQSPWNSWSHELWR